MTYDKPAFRGDDYDFAAGSIKGLRSWNMDDKGRLLGVTHPAVWLPGENVATCKARVRCPERKPSTDLSYSGMRLWYYDEPSSPFHKPCGADGCDGTYHPTTHTFDAACECGFWAYDEVGFNEHGTVVGVIEGYGRTTIGTKGFRCEKARIVALCRETDTEVMTLSRWLRLKHLYPEADFFDEYDDMVVAHGEVMKTWPEVGDDFWDDSVTDDQISAATAQLNALKSQMAAMSQAITYTSPRRWCTGGVA